MGRILLRYNHYAPVTQRIRVLGFEPRSRRFESCRAYQNYYNEHMDYLEEASGRLTPVAIEGSLIVVQDVFRQFRPQLLERTGKIGYTDKQDGSPVTDTDMEIEVALQA